MRLDLHVHTRGSDGYSSPEAIVERAIAAGLDGFAITDHHRVRTAEGDKVAELATKCGLKVFRGCEYSSDNGHLLLFGVADELIQTFGEYLPAQQVIDAVNGAGGCVVAAHPFRGYRRKLGAAVAELRGLAAWEGWNGQCTYQVPGANEATQDLAAKHNRRLTGGSDAHDARDLGLVWTDFPEEFSTDRGLVRALKRGGYVAQANEKRIKKFRALVEATRPAPVNPLISLLDSTQSSRQGAANGSCNVGIPANTPTTEAPRAKTGARYAPGISIFAPR